MFLTVLSQIIFHYVANGVLIGLMGKMRVVGIPFVSFSSIKSSLSDMKVTMEEFWLRIIPSFRKKENESQYFLLFLSCYSSLESCSCLVSLDTSSYLQYFTIHLSYQ